MLFRHELELSESYHLVALCLLMWRCVLWRIGLVLVRFAPIRLADNHLNAAPTRCQQHTLRRAEVLVFNGHKDSITQQMRAHKAQALCANVRRLARPIVRVHTRALAAGSDVDHESLGSDAKYSTSYQYLILNTLHLS